MSKKGARILELSILTIMLISFFILTQRVDTGEACQYNLLISKGVDNRICVNIKDANIKDSARKNIDGLYISRAPQNALEDIKRKNTLVVVPVYRDENGDLDEDLYEITYGIYDDENDLFFERGIYLINNKTIAIWDEEKGYFRILRKLGRPINLKEIEDAARKASRK